MPHTTQRDRQCFEHSKYSWSSKAVCSHGLKKTGLQSRMPHEAESVRRKQAAALPLMRCCHFVDHSLIINSLTICWPATPEWDGGGSKPRTAQRARGQDHAQVERAERCVAKHAAAQVEVAVHQRRERRMVARLQRMPAIRTAHADVTDEARLCTHTLPASADCSRGR